MMFQSQTIRGLITKGLRTPQNQIRFVSSSSTVKLDYNASAPLLGFGTWKSKPNQVKDAVKHAIKIGYRHIDCAPVYQNEQEVGDAIRESIAEGIVTRKDLFITSKLWNTFHRPEKVHVGLEKTLNDLQLEYLDLYIIHWPVAFRPAEPNNFYPKKPNGLHDVESVPLWETWEAMQDLKTDGMVKSLGVSNFAIHHLQELIDETEVVPSVNQIEMHPYLTQKQLVQFCRDNNIEITAYSPLGTGVPAQKDESKQVLLEDDTIVKLAQKYKKTPAQILLRWALQNRFITIPKSVTPARIAENWQVFDYQLSDEDMFLISSLNRNQRHVVPVWSEFANKNN